MPERNDRDFLDDETPGEYVTRRFDSIQGFISSKYHFMHGERKEECIAETLALFWRSFSELHEKEGPNVVKLVPSIVKYAVMTVLSGRGLLRCNSNDVMSLRCKFRNGVRKVALPQTDREPANPEALHALRDDTSPADQAILNVDFSEWVETLPLYQNHVVELSRAGESQTDIAEVFGTSRTRVWQHREEARKSYEQMFGT